MAHMASHAPDTLSGAFTTAEPWAIQMAPDWNAF